MMTIHTRRALRASFPFVVAGLVLACLGTAAPNAEAQYRHQGHGHGRARVGIAIFPPGLYVGAGLLGTKILGQSGGAEILEDGAGLSLYMGIRVSPQLAIEGGVSSSLHNPEQVQTAFGSDLDYLVLNGATVDAKIFFPGESTSVTPYAQGGVGLYLLDSDYFGTQSVGTGFQLGGGFDFELAPGIDLGLRALYKGISMGPPDSVDNDTFISALSAEANISLRF